VVGASLAGLHAVTTLRAEGFDGPLAVIGEELHLPYDRPPLSKQLLRGEWEPAQVMLPLEVAAPAVDWRLGRRAVGLDPETLELEFDDGARERFPGGIVVATGARPRMISHRPLTGVHVLRTLEDGVALAAELAERPRRVAIVGAGFIGAEVAASCRALDLDVTLLEAAAVPLELVLGPELGEIVAGLHRDEGVDVRVGVTATELLEDENGRVRGLHLSDGTELDADLVVVGIGVEPCTEWLEDSGLALDRGLIVDESCLAAPGVVAAGDVARFPNPRFAEVRRVEHWDNAIRQGAYAARRLLAGNGAFEPYAPIPWFWSDQYDVKMQLIGMTDGHDEVLIIQRPEGNRRLLALYRRGERMIGAFAMNHARAVLACRRLLEADPSWDEALAEVDRLRANSQSVG
jgi:NADPH-dependent 2,4-dienoyl-CoA reductase/sulfur reductase-like enzyme